MEYSVQFVLWKGVLYGLGALGLFSIGALPLRTYIISVQLKAASSPSWLFLTILAAAIGALVLASQFLFNLSKCLLGYHCSANAAGGWINAAFLGAIYICFEIVVFVVLWVCRRRGFAT